MEISKLGGAFEALNGCLENKGTIKAIEVVSDAIGSEKLAGGLSVMAANAKTGIVFKPTYTLSEVTFDKGVASINDRKITGRVVGTLPSGDAITLKYSDGIIQKATRQGSQNFEKTYERGEDGLIVTKKQILKQTNVTQSQYVARQSATAYQEMMAKKDSLTLEEFRKKADSIPLLSKAQKAAIQDTLTEKMQTPILSKTPIAADLKLYEKGRTYVSESKGLQEMAKLGYTYHPSKIGYLYTIEQMQGNGINKVATYVAETPISKADGVEDFLAKKDAVLTGFDFVAPDGKTVKSLKINHTFPFEDGTKTIYSAASKAGNPIEMHVDANEDGSKFITFFDDKGEFSIDLGADKSRVVVTSYENGFDEMFYGEQVDHSVKDSLRQSFEILIQDFKKQDVTPLTMDEIAKILNGLS